MKFLHKYWPWKVIDTLEATVSRLNVELAQERSRHDSTRIENHAIKGELKIHQERAVQHQKDARKMAQILALKGGFLGMILMCFSAIGQPIIRNPVTTNTLDNAPTTAYFLGWDGILTKPKWAVPPDGLGTNYWNTNGSFLFPIPHLAASNDLGWWNTGGDVSANATNHDWVIGSNGTNFSLLIGANATNNDANSTNFALLIGANGTNNDNLHAANNTNFTLLIGVNATNNDANSTNFALLMGSNGTNNSTAITNGAINNLSNLVATVGANDTNNASTKQADWLNPNNYIFIEEFEGRSSGDLTLGQHGWRVLGVGSGSASVTLNAAATTHPGMITLTPGGTVSGGMLIMMSGTTNGASDLLLPATTLTIGGGNAFTAWTNRWIFRTGSATNDMKCWIGMVNNIVYGNAKPADFIGVELDTTNNVNIQYISGASSTYTNVSGPLIQVSQWYDFVMYSTVNGTINFYINNANAGVINTSGNISTLGLNFLGDVWKTATTAQATMTFDYCSFIGTGTAR